jgi:poly(3-hydroxybutyrate) depolymerase
MVYPKVRGFIYAHHPAPEADSAPVNDGELVLAEDAAPQIAQHSPPHTPNTVRSAPSSNKRRRGGR